ncbi:MAG: ATP-binding protein [Leptospirales bacterium]|nr:ATP-binding protein [Leptospirales bacterium]
MAKDKEIVFIGSFVAKTSIVAEIINELNQDLLKMEYPQEEIFEITIAMDESVSNAVKATIENTPEASKKLYITVRYNITETEFDATIIDRGKGLDFIKTLNTTPHSKSNNYRNQLMDYTAASTDAVDAGTESKTHPSSLTINNENVSLNGVGAGLKIILSYMDYVFIEYIDKKEIIATNVSESTDGTIFNMKRKRRNFNNE